MSLPRFSTRRPLAVAMLFLAVGLLGVISYVRLPVELLPDLSYPKLVIHTSYPEVAPTEVERLITEPIEAETASVPGVQKVASISREGVSLVSLRFAWGTDMDFALLNVRERLDNLRDVLPATATRPRLLRVDPESEPIMTLTVSGRSGLRETKELAEAVIRRRLEQLDGVARAALAGGPDREIQVQVNPTLLLAYGLAPADVSSALRRANVSAPAGTVLQGLYRYPVRTLGELRTVAEIGDVVVGRGAPDGRPASGPRVSFRPIRLKDVATVTDGFAERESIARLDGEEAVGLLLFKEADANAVAVGAAVNGVIAELKREYPAVRIDVASSEVGFISAAIRNLGQEVVVGAVLGFLVLFLFLRDPRYPVIVAMAIPASVLATFGLLEASGVTLNIMSLGGLALGVGMLTDNSIVVLENIFRHREMGKGGAEAAAAGAEEVTAAVTASTLTTIGVFAPIVYVEGAAGQLCRDLALAITYSLTTSLVVSLTLLPAWAARFGGAAPPAAFATPARGGSIGKLLRRASDPPLEAFDRGFSRFAEWYHDALLWGLARPWRTLGWSALAFAAALYAGFRLPRELLPDVDAGAFEVRVETPAGSGLRTTADAAAAVEAVLLQDPGVDAVFSRLGRDVRGYDEGEERPDLNAGLLLVRLKRGERTARVLDRIRPVGARIADATVTMGAGETTALGRVVSGDGSDVAVRIRAEDLNAARTRAEEVARRLRRSSRLSDVHVGTEPGMPELQLEIRRDQAAAYGIDPAEVASAVEQAMRGARATDFVDFDRKVAVMVRYPEPLRSSRSTLETLRVRGVPLRGLVQVEEVVGPAEVRRDDQGRVITVLADVARGGVDRAVEEVRDMLRTLPPVPELRMEVGGENEEMRRSFHDLLIAFVLAGALVYMVLAAKFESLAHPFTILMAVPLSVIGAVLALVVMGQSINTMSLIGFVILVGIVDNDAVVKLDFINQARAGGMGVREAILAGGRVRLRPIVMTGLATIVGLMPMAFGLGGGAELQAPMATVVIGGLAVGTLLTLVVIPVVYLLIEEARERRNEAVGRGSSPGPGWPGPP